MNAHINFSDGCMKNFFSRCLNNDSLVAERAVKMPQGSACVVFVCGETTGNIFSESIFARFTPITFYGLKVKLSERVVPR
jgi:hypothetical protein